MRTHARPRGVIFLGPPGSGKGTQAARLTAELAIPAISTGEILRRECQSGTPLGETVRSVLASGQLVGDDLINEVVASRLRQPDCKAGFILDGYPRTVSQARFLDRLVREMKMRRPLVVQFEISDDEVVARLSRRMQCGNCGRIFSIDPAFRTRQPVCDRDGSALIQRADDAESSIRERLRLYRVNAEQLARYYKDRDYHRIRADRTPEEISAQLLQILSLVVVPSHQPALAGRAAYA